MNIAKAGKGAAVTALLCGVFHDFNCGYNLYSAIYGCVSNRTIPARRAAPSPVALGHLLKHVTSRNYGCTFVRIDSRTISRRHVSNLGFTKNIFAGLAHSRLSCRGAFRGCHSTGGTFFSGLSGKTFTIAGTSSGGKVIVIRGAGTSIGACSLHSVTSFGTQILRRSFRNVYVSVGKHRIDIPFVNHFGMSGLLTICTITIYLKHRPRSVLMSLDVLRPMGKHFRALHSTSKVATVISCTRAPSTLIGILAAVGSVLGGHNSIVAIYKTNKGHSGKGHPVVTRRTIGRDSGIIVADSGPHFRRPRSVVGSVLTKLGQRRLHGAISVMSHERTVHATYVLTRPNSIILITKGKRRSCRSIGKIGLRFSSRRIVQSVFKVWWARTVLCCLFEFLRRCKVPNSRV